MRTLTLQADGKEKTLNREAATSKDREQTNVKEKTLTLDPQSSGAGEHAKTAEKTTGERKKKAFTTKGHDPAKYAGLRSTKERRLEWDADQRGETRRET